MVSERGISFQECGLSVYVLNSLRAAMKRAAPGIILSSVKVPSVISDLDGFIIICDGCDKGTVL